jgi:hypothetical protein
MSEDNDFVMHSFEGKEVLRITATAPLMILAWREKDKFYADIADIDRLRQWIVAISKLPT